MNKILIVLIAAAMAGCASSYPKRYRYGNIPPGLKIAKALPASVDRHCARDVQKYDDGHPADGSRRIRCCYNPVKNFIWVAYGADDCVEHELCHASGRPDIECDKIH